MVDLIYCWYNILLIFFFNDTATTEIYTLSLHDALPILLEHRSGRVHPDRDPGRRDGAARSEEHTSELQSWLHLVCRLLLEKKNKKREEISDSINRCYISLKFRMLITA